MHHCGDDPSRRRNRHSNKIFLPRSARIRRLRIAGDIEASKPAGSRNQEQETRNRAKFAGAELAELGHHLGWLYELKSPPPRQHGGRNAERNHICKRIKFAAEIARSARHPGNASIQPIEQNSESDRLRSIIKMPRLMIESMRSTGHRVLDGAMNHLQNRITAERDVCRRE